ncbi:Hypothetical protein R9X50_00022000 [Acrodontium crateriforme]|uniref:O-methyltransferase n=1 Tax=Acrodontium crateriforme TaxID=150365 RepID=A0AAQ3M094_9PEZI|nr:Hypothetical protein R9X50_00022000 [Acrodontium crateriforme]
MPRAFVFLINIYLSHNVWRLEHPSLSYSTIRFLATMAATAHAFTKYREMVEVTTIRALMSLGVFDALSSEGTAISLEELSHKTSANASLLQRLLRVVVSTGMVDFDPGSGTYAHTDISLGYCSGQLPANFFRLMHDEVLKSCVCFPEWIRHNGRTADPAGPDSHKRCLATFRDGNDGKTLFDVLSADPERQSNFHAGMKAMADLHPFQGIYDFSPLTAKAAQDPSRTLFVDVGGGTGTFLASLMDSHPSLPTDKLVLQDLPPVIEMAHSNMALPSSITLQPHDFHTPQPVRGAWTYHIRACLHDYGDHNATAILAHIANAMAPDSTLLIEENIMPEMPVKDEVIALADVVMMVCGGRERSEGDWQRLLKNAGLEIRTIHRPHGGKLTWAVIEASLVKQ